MLANANEQRHFILQIAVDLSWLQQRLQYLPNILRNDPGAFGRWVNAVLLV
jgi:hypothetical protein